MVRQNALKIRRWADVFRLKTGVTTDRPCSFFIYYDHANSIIRNTQPLYMLLCSYWLSRFDIPEIFPQHDNHSISLVLY